MKRGPKMRTECRRGHGQENYRRDARGFPRCRVCIASRANAAYKPGWSSSHRMTGHRDTERESLVVRLVDDEGMTATAVGLRLGLTRERIRQIYTRATGRRVPVYVATKPCKACSVRYSGTGAEHRSTEAHQDAVRLRREARFWARADVSGGPDACWPWTGYINPGTGYAHVKAFGEWNAHRVAYVLAKGPIPKGLHIDHLCRNERCINPAHLEAVTPKENIRRGLGVRLREWHKYTVEGTPSRLKERCKHGHDLTVAANVYVYPSTGARLCRACASRRAHEYQQRRKARRAMGIAA